MALIPPDVGIRMRMQTEANLLQPATPAHETPADLPDLQPGRTFTARIQEALPDNTYRALVAGKSITLSLPEGAKTGDQMELVVVERSTKSIIARQAQADAAATPTASGQAYPFTRLSSAAQLIGQLLPADGKAPPAAQLNRGQPLMSTPPTSQAAALELAPTLAKAVTQSGLFYEAHQAQWVNGKLPLAQLLQEPQGQLSTASAFQAAASEASENRAATTPASAQPGRPPAMSLALAGEPLDATTTQPSAAQTALALAGTPDTPDQPATETELLGPGQTSIAKANPANPTNPTDAATATEAADTSTLPTPTPSKTGTLLQTLFGRHEKVGAGETAPAPAQTNQISQTSQPGQPIADELRPLVQQQLDAVATQRVFWHGEIWPNQSIDWEIEWAQQGEDQANAEEDSHWRTALSLTTPRLGRVDATLQLTSSGVHIVLATAAASSAVDLRHESAKLADALAAAGVSLLTFQIKQTNAAPLSTEPTATVSPAAAGT